jgi:hypothetical protein
MVEQTCEEFYKSKQMGKEVQFLRMDNAGENRKLAQRLQSTDWKLCPTIEYTARETPQHNHKAEVAIATIVKQGRAMMIEANLPEEKCYIIQYKAMETAAKLDGLIVKDLNGSIKSRVEHWSGRMPTYVRYLREWGEAGVVKIKKNSTPKLADRGITCMLVGYADYHTGDCYKMLNWKTKRILVTRDVLWLKRTYFGNFKGELQKDKSIVTLHEEENITDTLIPVEEDTIDLYEQDQRAHTGGTNDKDHIETIFNNEEGDSTKFSPIQRFLDQPE